MEYSEEELEARIKLIIREIKAFPTDAQELDRNAAPSMRQLPYWSLLLEQIEKRYGSLQAFYQQRIPPDFLSAHYHDFPSPDQEETTTQMLEKSHLLIRDRAGAGKTAPLIKAKLALEQLVLQGEKLNAVVVCPNFVLSSWQAKLREYLSFQPRVLTLTSANREAGIAEFEKGIQDSSLDFTLISYDALFRSMSLNSDSLTHEVARLGGHGTRIIEEQFTLADRIVHAIENSSRPFMLTLDESHNARNPEALRSMAVRKLASAADYLYALTGNPFPDYLDDIGELASLLDSENYPTAEDFNQAYEQNPRLIRLFLRRFSKEPVISFENIPGSPVVHLHPPTWLRMSPEEESVYWEILNDRELTMGCKFALLRMAATDIKLLLPEYHTGGLKKKLERFFTEQPELRETVKGKASTKYHSLDALVDNIVERGDKVVIWTKLREGITTALEERYQKYGALRIDGTVDSEPRGRRYSDRDLVRLTFQTNPDCKVLVATLDALREGQDLHAANHAIFIMRDYSPGVNDQAIGRIARRGQQKEVHVHSLLMQETVDEGIFTEIEVPKRAGIMEAEGGYELSKTQREVLQGKTPPLKQTPMRKYLMNAHSHIRIMSGHMINKGADLNRNYLGEGENARIYAQAYNFRWNTSYSAHTARLIAQLVHEIEEKEGISLESIIDLGSGPATVSRILKRPATCIDINPHQLELGRQECEKLGINIETLVGNVEDLPEINDGRFDLGVLSLVLHYGNFENGGRKRMVLETNRVAQKYAILTLPSRIVQGDGRKLLEEGLYLLGLEPLKERTGIVTAVDGLEEDFEVYVAVCRKIHSNPATLYTDQRYESNFILNPDFFYKDLGGKEQKIGGDKRGPQGYRSEVCSLFRFVESGDLIKGKTLPPKKDPQPDRKSRTPEEILNVLNRFMGMKK